MGLMRSVLLWASENQTLRDKIPQMKFVRKALKKFMPGETVDEAISAARYFHQDNIPVLFTRLGENLKNISEADEIKNHYLELIDTAAKEKLDIEISLKLTQLGFDLSEEQTFRNFKEIAQKSKKKLKNTVWIDMEGSAYTQRTINFYLKMKKDVDNVGLCIQAYLFETHEDLNRMMHIKPSVRLVKGAYKESPDIALKDKFRVDENYLDLAHKMLKAAKDEGIRVVFGTHDLKLIEAIITYAGAIDLGKDKYEFHMLYGIKSKDQIRLAGEGYKVRTLISYGTAWYPWYLRRLAERPANVIFVLKNLFAN